MKPKEGLFAGAERMTCIGVLSWRRLQALACPGLAETQAEDMGLGEYEDQLQQEEQQQQQEEPALLHLQHPEQQQQQEPAVALVAPHAPDLAADGAGQVCVAAD